MALTLTQLTNDYMASVQHEQGCTATTRQTYRSWLNAFLKWTAANGTPDDLTAFTPHTLRAYLYSLSMRGLRPRTVRSAFHPLRGMSHFLIKHGVLTENPTLEISLPRKDAAIRQLVSTEEVRALLEGASRLHPKRRRVLARAMMATLTMTGVRFQEWLALRMQDFDAEHGTLLIANGKGQKSRMLYPPQECLAALQEWLVERGAMQCKHDYLFAYDRGRRMAEISARRLLEEVKAAVNLAGHDNIKPHSLRHAFASRMLTQGANLKVIQCALGHTDIKTTAIYLHEDERETAKMAQYASLTPPVPVRSPETLTVPFKPSQAQFQQRRRRRTPANR